MNTVTDTEKFWNDLKDRVALLPASPSRRFVDRARNRFGERCDDGYIIARLGDGPVYDRALDMMVSDIEKMAAEDNLRTKVRRYELRKKEFWLTVAESLGFDDDEEYEFDPYAVAIRTREKQEPEAQSSTDAAAQSLCKFVQASLDPTAGWQMADDARLPAWLQQLASRVSSDKDLAPELRKQVQGWIDDPELARESAKFMHKNGIPRWLVNTAHALGLRKGRFV